MRLVETKTRHLEAVLADMVRSALAWEATNGRPPQNDRSLKVKPVDWPSSRYTLSPRNGDIPQKIEVEEDHDDYLTSEPK